MTTKGIRERFRIEANSKSEGSYDTFVNEESDEFISFAIRQFYERRLNGATPDKTSYEQWQKRSDDLKCVYTKYESNVISNGVRNGSKWVSYDIPKDYWHMLSEDIDVIDSNGNVLFTTDVVECTTDNISKRLENRLSEHILYRGKLKPLRVYEFEKPVDLDFSINYLDTSKSSVLGNSVISVDDSTFLDITDDSKSISMSSVLYYDADSVELGKYKIEYIRKPNGFGLYSDENKFGVFDENKDIHQVPEYAWDEVLSIAIKHALENTSSYRIQTYQSEKVEIQ